MKRRTMYNNVQQDVFIFSVQNQCGHVDRFFWASLSESQQNVHSLGTPICPSSYLHPPHQLPLPRPYAEDVGERLL